MFDFHRACNTEEMATIGRLRYEVYCCERRFLDAHDYPDGIETDELDEYSVSFIAKDTAGSLPILGCCRLILANHRGFPCEQHFHLWRRAPDPSATVEISRVIVAPAVRTMWRHIIMGLTKEVYIYARDNGVDYCYAVVEEMLLKALKRLGLPFEQIGPMGCFMGETVPAGISRTHVEQILPSTNAWFYDYLQAPREDQGSWF